MYGKRATLHTISSLTALSKVSSSRNSLIYIKTLAFVNYLSVAAPKHFEDPNGSNGENGTEYQKIPSGFSGVDQYNVEYQQKSSGHAHGWGYRGNDSVFQQTPNGSYSFNQNTVEFQQKSSGRVHGWAYRGNNREFQQNPDGFDRGNSVAVGQTCISSDHCGERSRDMWQNPSGFSMESSRNLQSGSNQLYGQSMNIQNLNGSYREGLTEAVVNPTGFSAQSTINTFGPQVSVNSHYGETAGQFQPSLNDQHLQNAVISQQNPTNYHVGDYGMSQQSAYSHYTGSDRSSQQTLGNNYMGKDGTYHQSPSGYYGENVRSLNGHLRQNVGEFQQNPSAINNANAGYYQRVSTISHNEIMSPAVSSSSKHGESVEAAERNPFSGTIEELDYFCKEGKLKEALEILGLLEQRHIPVDMPRYLMLVKACGEANALKEAKSVHEHLMRSGCRLAVSTYNKILEMYSKCHSMDDAYTVFHNMLQHNLTSWDTMITWLAKNGLGEDAIELFTQFKKSGLKPDGRMFLGVFSACSVLGDIDEGMLHFKSMSKDYGIDPSMEHYVSIVDMLGSAGYLDEALEFIEKMPIEPSTDIWETLMNHCWVHGNRELGDRCVELVELLDPSCLNEQSKAGLIAGKALDLAKEKEKEKKKSASQNLLEVRSRVHEYRAGDTSHPDSDKIYAMLRGMKQQMKEAGYVPETKFVLHDIDQEGKEEALLSHSERLAVAQGLISSPARSPIRIIKNLRVCGDCHNALKIISQLVGRELIIRDAKRFHHFKDGLCSCRDYW